MEKKKKKIKTGWYSIDKYLNNKKKHAFIVSALLNKVVIDKNVMTSGVKFCSGIYYTFNQGQVGHFSNNIMKIRNLNKML